MNSFSTQRQPSKLSTTTSEITTILLGGTFDPFHNGHLALLTELHEHFAADEWMVLPLHRPPHRPPPSASPEDRLAMVQEGVKALSWLSVNTMEVDRGGMTYTIDTTHALLAERPERSIWWIIGADEARALPSWHRFDELIQCAHFVIVHRKGEMAIAEEDMRMIGIPQHRFSLCSVTPPEMSSTTVRNRIRQHESILDAVPLGVATYIAAHLLYVTSPDHA